MAIKEGSHTLDPSLIRNGSVRINRIAHREGAMQAQRWRRRIGSNVARSYLRPSMTGSRLVKALDEVGGEVDQVLRRRCFERSGGFSTFQKACGERAGLVEKVCDGAANTRDSPFYMDVRALVPPVSFPVPCPRATHLLLRSMKNLIGVTSAFVRIPLIIWPGPSGA